MKTETRKKLSNILLIINSILAGATIWAASYMHQINEVKQERILWNVKYQHKQREYWRLKFCGCDQTLMKQDDWLKWNTPDSVLMPVICK